MKNKQLKIIINRIRLLAPEIIPFTIASVCDLVALAIMTIIFTKILEDTKNAVFYFGLLLILAITRSLAVFLLRRKAIRSVFIKKSKAESRILEKFIATRIKLLMSDEATVVNNLKEKLINSTQIATVNFDIPILSIAGELIFAIGGTAMLIWHLGLLTVLSALPICILLILLMKRISRRLRDLGHKMLELTEMRLKKIDNLAESAVELGALSHHQPALIYFDKTNLELNMQMSNQISLSSAVQLLFESISFIIIGLTLLMIASGNATLTIGGAASAIAIFARFVPAITRSLASITQLSYGVPAVLRLENND